MGIALGGGGAKGLAHILMLEALDELGVKPYRISGCSIGAVIGALPGMFVPVVVDGRVLVDGGTVNPVPYDLLIDDCDIVIAIDVMGKTSADTRRLPSFFDAIFNTRHIMQQSILVQKMRNHQPDIYVKPDITDIRMLEFYEADRIYKQSEVAKQRLKLELEKRLS